MTAIFVEAVFMPSGCHLERKSLVTERHKRRAGVTPLLAKRLGGMMIWLYEIAGRSQLALVWLAAVAIGAVIYFFPIARLLESLAE